LYGVFIDRTSGVGLTHSAHCSSLGSGAPTGRVSKWAGRPGAAVVPGDADAWAVAEGTVLVAPGAELGVTVVAPPLEHAPSAATPRTAKTTRLLQRPPGMARA
jgi:hypothetical protein